MPRQFCYRVLIVDDDVAFSSTLEQILSAASYQVEVAEDGFDALTKLRAVLPDIVICDLKMPRMSGFEFLSVLRRRFPQIPVISVTGEFTGSAVPEGVIADAFFEKGSNPPSVLLGKMQELLAQSPIRASLPKPKYAPVWIPVNGKNYFVVTCTECLRSFSVPMPPAQTAQRIEGRAACEFCSTSVDYLLDLRGAQKHKPGSKSLQLRRSGAAPTRHERIVKYPQLRSGAYFADFRSDRRLRPEVVHCIIQREGSPEILSWTQHTGIAAAVAVARGELERMRHADSAAAG